MPRPCLADLEGLLGLRSSSMPSCQVHCPIHQHILQGERPYDRKSGSDGVRAWTSCMAHANSSSSSGPRRRVAFCRRIAVSHTSFECFKDNGKRELDYVPKTARMKSINSSYLAWQSPRIRSMCANWQETKTFQLLFLVCCGEASHAIKQPSVTRTDLETRRARAPIWNDYLGANPVDFRCEMCCFNIAVVCISCKRFVPEPISNFPQVSKPPKLLHDTVTSYGLCKERNLQ